MLQQFHERFFLIHHYFMSEFSMQCRNFMSELLYNKHYFMI